MIKRTSVLLAAAAIGIAAFAGAAAANPSNGLTGACNMVNTNAQPGMFNAMGLTVYDPDAHGTGNGNSGMFGATGITGGGTC